MEKNDVAIEGTNTSLLSFLNGFFGQKEYEILPLAGDASTRKYYRIVQADKSWVLMSWDPFADEENYPFLSVQKHFRASGVKVPEVIRVAPQLGLVLLEDLGDLTLERKFWENQNQEVALPFYYQSIDELIKIHFVASGKPGNCTAFQIAFDTAKFLWEMNYGREHVIDKMGRIQLSEQEQADLQKIFTSICETLDREPKFISHRDYHSRNVMIKLGRVSVIDFQDARMGPLQYDLVSLLYDSYVNLNSRSKDEILSYYLSEARHYLPRNYSRAHFDEIMKFQIIQRCFKACGSFASFYNNRGDKRYLKYIHPTLQTVASHLKDLPQYRPFLDILTRHGLLEKKFEDIL